MADARTTIDPKTADFIRAQHIFFVATAPLSAEGLVNLSPKGLDTFRVLDDHTAAYLDITGSGIETVAHIKENGRITIMFCAFDGPPNIVRLHGRGEVIEPSHSDFTPLLQQFPPRPGIRAVIRIHVHRVSSSCGYAVPFMDFRAERTKLDESCTRKGEDGLRAYRDRKNRQSLDGLPGLVE